MAGMIQEQTKQQLNGIPGLMNLPVLGALFKSRDFVNRQTELMVLVTPYIVRAVAQKDLSRPDDGYADASDPATSLLGRFNRLYGTPGQDNPREQELPRQCRLHSRLRHATRRRSMHCDILNVAGAAPRRLGARGLLIAGFAAALAGCNTTTASDTTGSIPSGLPRAPSDRGEGRQEDASMLFVGAGRGGLSPTQRAEVLAFAQNWKRDATGGVTIDRPVGGANERAANDTLKEALSIIVQAGVPNSGIGIRPYHPGANSTRPCGSTIR